MLISRDKIKNLTNNLIYSSDNSFNFFLSNAADSSNRTKNNISKATSGVIFLNQLVCHICPSKIFVLVLFIIISKNDKFVVLANFKLGFTLFKIVSS